MCDFDKMNLNILMITVILRKDINEDNGNNKEGHPTTHDSTSC